MRKFAILAILLIIPVWMGLYYIADRGIEFDPMTEKILKEELQTVKLTKNLVKSVEILDLSNRNLTSISGLEHFTNLKELILTNNLLTDVTPLKNLQRLVTLDLSFNQISNLDLNHANLELLNLEGNRLTSIEFVSSLGQLLDLNLRDNQIVDLAPLSSLQNLQALNIRGNQIKRLDPLATLVNLQDLNARNNQISSIEPIINLPVHTRLYVTGNDIADLQLLAEKVETIDDVDVEIGIQKPELRMPSGVYADSFELEMRTAPRHLIFYTLDGSIPTLQSPQYKEAIEISEEVMLAQPVFANHQTSPLKEAFEFAPEDVKKGVTVTAVSYFDGAFSEPVSQTYIFDTTLFDSQLPVVSLIMDPKDFFSEEEGIYVPGVMYRHNYFRTGNYYQKGRQFEKEGLMEFFNENGDVSFRQNIGVRINGSYTRLLPQKSLRIYPRSDYGQSRIYSKLFEDLPYHEFNRLILRSSGNDNDSTMMRDGLMQELIKDTGLDLQGYKPSIVLLNGEYWGIHNIRERYDEDYIDIKYNVKAEDLVMLSVYTQNGLHYEIDVGTAKDRLHYFELLDYITENDMTDDAHIEHINTMMDIENFLDYVAVQVYYANTDSFHNNTTVWRKKSDYIPNAPIGHDGRWRWMVYDMDFGMGYAILQSDEDPLTFNMIDRILDERKSMDMTRNLLANEKVKERFIEKLLILLNNNFEPDRVHQKIDELAAVIRPEMPKSIARWENIRSIEVWEANIRKLHEFASKRPDIVRDHILTTFGLTKEQLDAIEDRTK